MSLTTAGPALRARVAERAAERGIGGLVWAVAIGDEMVTGAVGWRDPSRRRTPMTDDALFRIASVTKPVVAALAMRMLGSGVPRLDDPVATWLPELADIGVLRDPDGPWDGPTEALRRPITVRDVLTLRTGWGMDFGRMDQPHLQRLTELGIGPGPTAPDCTSAEFVARLASVPLAEQPGTRWRYHVGSDLLGVLLERISGEPLDVLLRRELLEPCAMRDTAFWVTGGAAARLGEALTVDGGARVVFDGPEGRWSRRPAMFSGGAGLVSTAASLVSFGLMVARRGRHGTSQVIPAELVEQMCSNQLTPAQREDAAFGELGWGLGIGVRVEDAARGWPTAGCVGWDGGLGSRLLIDPTREAVLVVLATDGFECPGMPEILDDIESEVAAVALG